MLPDKSSTILAIGRTRKITNLEGTDSRNKPVTPIWILNFNEYGPYKLMLQMARLVILIVF